MAGLNDISVGRVPSRRLLQLLGASVFLIAISILALHRGTPHIFHKVSSAAPTTTTEGGFRLGGRPGYDPAPASYPADDAHDTIPNVVNFVYALEDPSKDFHFHFSHFLSVYAAHLYCRPHIIRLHTNADDATIARARAGQSGKWTASIFNMPGLEINRMGAPTRAGNGLELTERQHVSDFMRVLALRDFGGTYIDFDVITLRDTGVLRRAGFRAVVGRQINDEINSGTFLVAAGCDLITSWWEQMNKVYDGTWSTHSNQALTQIASRLVRTPGESLIMDHDAFAPLSWFEEHSKYNYAVHDDAKSPLDALDWSRGPVSLPEFPEGDAAERPHWARDFSTTYLLHGFDPKRYGYEIHGFKGLGESLSPRYVLNRQSNYARAVYPIVRDMYHRGLVEIDDTPAGN